MDNNTPLHPSRLFIDMDGTLAEFIPADSVESLYEPGRFRNLRPQQNIVDGVRQIIAQHPETEVYILSAYLTDSPYALAEKQAWLDEHLPEIDGGHRIFTPCGQSKAGFIPGGIRPGDTLYDDYNKNLEEWEHSGGMSVKCVNGINHKGLHGSLWEGELVRYDNTPGGILRGLLQKEQISIDIIRTQLQNLREQGVPASEYAKAVVEQSEGYRPDPESLKEILDFKAKFYQYSIGNAELIRMQNPFASYVGSFTHFKELGYSVNAGESGMVIIKPAPVKMFIDADGAARKVSGATPHEKQLINSGKLEVFEKTYFNPGYVFDISQTNCPMEDLPKLYRGVADKPDDTRYYAALKEVVLRHGIALHEEPLSSVTLQGFFRHEDDSITINTLATTSNQVHTLSHEAAHALLHKNAPDMPKPAKEFEAEAASYIALKRAGFDVSDYSFSYTAHYYKDMTPEQIRKSLHRIDKCAEYMSEHVESALAPALELEQSPETPAIPQTFPEPIMF